MKRKDLFIVILFYKFVQVENPEEFAAAQKEVCRALELKGRLLVAPEGINGTFEGKQSQIKKYQTILTADPRFSDVSFKESESTGEAFPRLSVKAREEVVTLGMPDLKPEVHTAPEVTAEELQQWYENGEEFTILDLRNNYEIASGYFEGTEHPDIENFRDLPENMDKIAHLKNKKVVPVCTGGIRCEKATAYLKEEGFTDMYQLKNGIHDYMQKFPNGKFKGTLFVFDNRITTALTDEKSEKEREIVGKCEFCDVPCEQYVNDDSKIPSRKLICCNDCFEPRREEFREIVTKQEVVV